MKLAIFLQHYFPYGGLQRDALRLAETAQQAGDEPTLIVSTWDGPMPDGIPVKTLHSGGTSNHAKAERFARACQDELAHFDTSIGFHRVPSVPFHFCGDACIKARFEATKPAVAKLLPRYRHQLQTENAVFGPQSDTHLFFLAQNEVADYQAHYGLTATRFTLLPPWLRPAETFAESRDTLRARLFTELNLEEPTQLLLFVGSNFKLKRLHRIVEALPLLDASVHLAVCGDDDANTVTQLANKLQVSQRVHWLRARNDLPSLMTSADLLVHPSERETAGMVLTEALTYGLPVTCTKNCGYAPHVAAAGGTILSEACPATELADAVHTMLGNLTPLREQALQWAANPDNYRAGEVILDRMRSIV
jgi:UDP-glucose:(heptosyl)LPS alpha-1,3-glucosyltransferase